MKKNDNLAFEIVKEVNSGERKQKIFNIDEFNKLASRGKVKPKRVSIKEKSKPKEVYALKTKEEIDRILNYLNLKIELSEYNDKQVWERNKLLFLIGINVGLRASDLRVLKWEFFFKENKVTGKFEFKSFYSTKPDKTERYNKFVKVYFNDAIKEAVRNYIKTNPIVSLSDYVFASNKDKTKPITVPHISRTIKEIAEGAGIEQNIASHSLRKTWGYWCFANAEDKTEALVILQSCFNHSDTRTTMRYIGLTDEEKREMFFSIKLGFGEEE